MSKVESGLAPGRTPQPSGVRVILVEDNFLVARQLRRLLERAGFDVRGVAGSLEAATALIESEPFDVAVLDIMLGSRSVAELATRLHREGRPLLFLSGYADLDMLPEELQASPRLGKPVDPPQLFRALLEVARSSKTRLVSDPAHPRPPGGPR